MAAQGVLYYRGLYSEVGYCCGEINSIGFGDRSGAVVKEAPDM